MGTFSALVDSRFSDTASFGIVSAIEATESAALGACGRLRWWWCNLFLRVWKRCGSLPSLMLPAGLSKLSDDASVELGSGGVGGSSRFGSCRSLRLPRLRILRTVLPETELGRLIFRWDFSGGGVAAPPLSSMTWILGAMVGTPVDMPASDWCPDLGRFFTVPPCDGGEPGFST